MLKIIQFQSPSRGQENLPLEQVAKVHPTRSFLCQCSVSALTGPCLFCTGGLDHEAVLHVGGLTETEVQNSLPQPISISSFQVAGDAL